MADISINNKDVIRSDCDNCGGNCSIIKYALVNGLHYDALGKIVFSVSQAIAAEQEKIFKQIHEFCKNKRK